ncbi:hypothetical protein [Caballeronia sp. LZ034LL]|uniref:hypothetical protein n=1 Tax=Caballeronia sp. LZ034LL TaxID=3038567 RepID=UPI0028617912|nr:hypothetical protein [Caballeronia sp. LZ034LL]MDR5833328.1 hypothetical protein [Caballeronia sp. LZ034LL]
MKAMKRFGKVVIVLSCIGGACFSCSVVEAADVTDASTGRSYAEHLRAKSRPKRVSKGAGKERKRHNLKPFAHQSWSIDPRDRDAQAIRQDTLRHRARSRARDSDVELISN